MAFDFWKRPNIPNMESANICNTDYYKSVFFGRPNIIHTIIPTMKGNFLHVLT